MKIYLYDSRTLEFLVEDVADPSPLEPGVFLIPAHATVLKPPTPAPGMVARFVEGAWVLCPVTQVVTPPLTTPGQLDQAISVRCAEAEGCAAARTQRVPYSFGVHGVQHFQVRDDDDKIAWLTLWRTADSLLGNGAGATLLVRTEENVNIPMSAQQVADAMKYLADYCAEVRKDLWRHKDNIRSLDSVAGVLAYDLNTGWDSDAKRVSIS